MRITDNHTFKKSHIFKFFDSGAKKLHFLPPLSKSFKTFQKIIDLKKSKVNGSVKLKLYKGNVIINSRITKSNAYSMKKVSFEENRSFNIKNVERFINFHKTKL